MQHICMQFAVGFIAFLLPGSDTLYIVHQPRKIAIYISDSMSIQGYAVLFENVKTSATMLHSGGFTAR